MFEESDSVVGTKDAYNLAQESYYMGRYDMFIAFRDAWEQMRDKNDAQTMEIVDFDLNTMKFIVQDTLVKCRDQYGIDVSAWPVLK